MLRISEKPGLLVQNKFFLVESGFEVRSLDSNSCLKREKKPIKLRKYLNLSVSFHICKRETLGAAPPQDGYEE